MTTDYEKFEGSSTAARRLLRQEELILDVTETVCEAMNRDDVKKADLAHALGKTRGFVSQVLNGGRNLTLRTVSDVADALGYVVQFRMVRDASSRSLERGGAKAEWKLEVRPSSDAPFDGTPAFDGAWSTEMKAGAVIRAGDVPTNVSEDEKSSTDLCLV